MQHIVQHETRSKFDMIKQTDENGIEYWSARDLGQLMGYSSWQRFETPLNRAMTTAKNEGHIIENLFTRSVEKGAGRPKTDFRLARYAAYLVAMNGDPNMDEVAKAQSYFAIQTRVAEVQKPKSLQERSLDLIGELSAEVEKEKQRADVAEDRIDTIEGGNGISVREFHKHYFSETSEREFNELLYRKGLLLDQRGQRVGANGKPKPGKQHRHPSFKGKQFFELHPHIDKETGDRYYNVKVRPGKPETDLVEQLERWGLGSNKGRRQKMLQLGQSHGLQAVV